MKCFLYSSICTCGPYEIQDLDILRNAISNNQKYGISGFLHRSRHNYFQYIEGADDNVEQLITNLVNDRRHLGFQALMAEKIDRRRFTDWSMGYSSDLGIFSKQPITTAHPTDEILRFLLEQADRQAQKPELTKRALQKAGTDQRRYTKMQQGQASTQEPAQTAEAT